MNSDAQQAAPFSNLVPGIIILFIFIHTSFIGFYLCHITLTGQLLVSIIILFHFICTFK